MNLKFVIFNIVYLIFGLALICFAIPHSEQELRSIYNTCCGFGKMNARKAYFQINQIRNTIQFCSLNVSSLFVTSSYLVQCTHIAKICCYQTLKKETCDLAIHTVKGRSGLNPKKITGNELKIKENFLKYYRQCVPHPDVLKNFTLLTTYFYNSSNLIFGHSLFVFRECCAACKMGIFAAIHDYNCTYFELNIYNSFPNKAFEDCCLNFKQNKHLNLTRVIDKQVHIQNLELELLDTVKNELDFKLSNQLPITILNKQLNYTNRSQPICPEGYQLIISQNSKQCIDIDECKTNSHDCDLNTHFCINTNGSFVCEKVKILNKPQTTKSNVTSKIDLCKIGNHNCQLNEKCIMKSDSYVCINLEKIRKYSRLRTKENYSKRKFDGLLDEFFPEDNFRHAIESEETDEINDFFISSNSTCTNSSCKTENECKSGFYMNNVTLKCEDINECQINLFKCEPHFRCDNTYGSYQCVRETPCGTGYTYNSDAKVCEDNDECVLGNHNCKFPYFCVNTRGSFRCEIKKCNQDYRLNKNGECEQVICAPGFKFNNFSNKCVDINECELDSKNDLCKNDLKCVNVYGSYKCLPKESSFLCFGGTKFNFKTNQCIDINECESNGHECNSFDKCINTYGSYFCKCDKGLEWNEKNKHCEDIDECKRRINNCSQICTNTFGSFKCACKAGFQLSSSDNATCEELNECSDYKLRNNLNNQNSTNRFYRKICRFECRKTENSFKCICPEGYLLGTDGTSCLDIDECKLNLNICNKEKGNKLFSSTSNNQNIICINTIGSYKCVDLECPIDYLRDKRNNLKCKLNDYSTQLCLNQLKCNPKKSIIYSYSFVSLKANNSVGPIGLRIASIRGASKYDYEYNLLKAISTGESDNKINLATKQDFLFVRDKQDNIFLKKPLEGPQEVQLEYLFKLKINQTEIIVNKLLLTLFVSKYNF